MAAINEGIFTVMDVRYKVWPNGFVFIEIEGEWVKSTVTKEELLARPRNDDAE